MRTEHVPVLEWATPHEIAQLAGVSLSTARRWKSGRARAQPAAITLLEIVLGGHVGPAAGPTWAGWWFDARGRLCQVGVRNESISAGELAAYFLLRRNGEHQNPLFWKNDSAVMTSTAPAEEFPKTGTHGDRA